MYFFHVCRPFKQTWWKGNASCGLPLELYLLKMFILQKLWRLNSLQSLHFSVTRKRNTISPNVWKKKWPKILKFLHQSLIWKPKTSTLSYFWNLQTNHRFKLLVWVKIGWVKSSLNGEVSPNLVTLAANYTFDYYGKLV